MLKILAAVAVFACSIAIAVAVSDEGDPTISAELTVLPLAMVAEKDRVAVLGDKAVVTNAVAAKYNRPQSGSGAKFRVAQDPIRVKLRVVQDPITEDYGTTDGGILVHLHSADTLEGLAADYGLTVHHAFSAVPMGVLKAQSVEAAPTYINTLRDDSRVISAELDVSYMRMTTN